MPRDGPKRLARTEATIALLQCGVAFVFVIGAYTGLFDIPSQHGKSASPGSGSTTSGSRFTRQYRVRGKTLAWVEPLIPLLEVSCATAVYIALDDPVSPVRAIYL